MNVDETLENFVLKHTFSPEGGWVIHPHKIQPVKIINNFHLTKSFCSYSNNKVQRTLESFTFENIMSFRVIG